MRSRCETSRNIPQSGVVVVPNSREGEEEKNHNGQQRRVEVISSEMRLR
jgi:hypothetical protein